MSTTTWQEHLQSGSYRDELDINAQVVMKMVQHGDQPVQTFHALNDTKTTELITRIFVDGKIQVTQYHTIRGSQLTKCGKILSDGRRSQSTCCQGRSRDSIPSKFGQEKINGPPCQANPE